jgi:hypothetical protein
MSYLAGTLTPVAPQEPATMPVNRIQFQPGISMPEFFSRYGSEEHCARCAEGVALAPRIPVSALQSR